MKSVEFIANYLKPIKMKYFNQNIRYYIGGTQSNWASSTQSDVAKTISNNTSPEGDGVTGLQSHVERYIKVLIQLVESFIVLKYFHGVATPALYATTPCHFVCLEFFYGIRELASATPRTWSSTWSGPVCSALLKISIIFPVRYVDTNLLDMLAVNCIIFNYLWTCWK